jgi:propanediol dehydratase large subunit
MLKNRKSSLKTKAKIVTSFITAIVLFGGCAFFGAGDPTPDNDGVTTRLYASEGDELFIDLEDPGNPVAAGDNQDWDLIFDDRKEILTNSGVTAAGLGSSGLGGVVFSGYTSMSQTISVSDAEDLFTAAAGATGIDKGLDFAYWSKYRDTSTAGRRDGNAMSFPALSARKDATAHRSLTPGSLENQAVILM